MRYGSKDSVRNVKVTGTLRKPQIITTFGSGSMVDMAEYSVIMASTDYWTKSNRIYEPNLQRLLGVNYFQEPKSSETDLPNGNPDIPAFRFPMMHYCLQCNRLMSYRDFGNLHVKKCPECNKSIIPSRFIAACDNGHLEDFPYRWWVHHGDFSSCHAADKYDKLKIEFSSTSGGLGSITIKCTACGKERTMEGCMSKGALKGYKCKGRRPWIGMKNENSDSETCGREMRALQRGASNVYFPLTQSSLTIPPWSKGINAEIEQKWEEILEFMDDENDYEIKRKLIKALFKNTLSKGRYNLDDLMNCIESRMRHTEKDSNIYSEIKLLEEEYKALCVPYEGEVDDKFKTYISDVPEDFKEYIEDVVLVKRLREVLALKGFRRIMPGSMSKEVEVTQDENTKDYTPLSSEKLNWLPAVEMIGEGIFIRFSENIINEWEKRTCNRYEHMCKNMASGINKRDNLSPRYVMLHTFAHLLIRQLTIKCGYSSSALKERIYSTYNDSEIKMSGVLIYTSSSDSDGSLGGLVREGEADTLNDTILNLLQEASWCASDPMCIDSMQQGYNSLNYAACHACALLPETSCESRNSFLDRVAVVGKMEERSLGFFGNIFEE